MWPFSKSSLPFAKPPLCVNCRNCIDKGKLSICTRGASPLGPQPEHFCSVERGDYGYGDRCGPKGKYFEPRMGDKM